MSTLIEISTEMAELMEMLDGVPDDAENRDQVKAILDAAIAGTRAEMERKLEGYASVRQEYLLRVEARKKEAERLLTLCKSDESKAQSLHDTMLWAMREHEFKRIEGARFRLVLQQNGGLAPMTITAPITDIPRTYIRERIVEEIDKAALRTAVESGQEIPGVVIGERGWRVSIK